MTAVLFRIGLLTAGLGAVELGIVPALRTGAAGGWALVLLVGVPLIVAGSAGFMRGLLGGGQGRRGGGDA